MLRLLSHGWLEEATMHVLRTRLIQKLRAADRHSRLRVMYPHIPGLAPECCLDVHSKLMIVDERVLRIGSSNLSNRSMSMDTECDMVVESRGSAPGPTGSPFTSASAQRKNSHAPCSLMPVSICVGKIASEPALRSMKGRVRDDSTSSNPNGKSVTPAVSANSGGRFGAPSSRELPR